jgi:hypothetical protein
MTQPDRDEQIRQILAYLEQHRAQYDLAALRRQLLDAGYPNTLVDEALRRLDGGTSSSGPGPRLIGCLLSVVNDTLLFAIVFLVGALGGDITVAIAVPLVVLAVELVVAGALWNRPGSERASRLLLWTAIWSAATILGLVALAALFLGLCIALYNSQI